MKKAFVRKILASIPIIAICAALTQPILSYMGGVLPDLPADDSADADCAISAIFEAFEWSEASGDEAGLILEIGSGAERPGESDFNFGTDMLYENGLSGTVSGTSLLSAGAQPENGVAAFEGDTISLVHAREGYLSVELNNMLNQAVGERRNLSEFITLVIYTGGVHMDMFDWFSLRYINIQIPNIKNLTVKGLAAVEAQALLDSEPWVVDISLPDTLTVGEEAFLGCASLASVSLPKVTAIGARAFSGCGLLSEFHFGSMPTFGENVITQTDRQLTVYFTSGNWNGFNFNGLAPNTITKPENVEAPLETGKSVPEASSPQSSPKSSAKKPSKAARSETAQSEPDSVDSEELAQAVQSIAEAAEGSNPDRNGGDSSKKPVTLRFVNKSYISLEQLRQIARESQAAEVDVTVHADTKVGNTVVNRIYIDPSKATQGISLMTGKDATKVLRRFELYTENTLAVLSLDQQESFGMKVGVAFKLALPEGLDEKNLAIYAFNAETGKYKRIFIPRKRMKSGYLWLETDHAGFIVVSDGTLKFKP